MAHCVVPAAEAILDKEFKVLDKGFVRLVDYMGGDDRIVQAARVSYGAGTKSYREDAGLIDYLLRHEHTSPFEQVILTFHVKLPIFVARQWIRHRTARVNEVSPCTAIRFPSRSEKSLMPGATASAQVGRWVPTTSTMVVVGSLLFPGSVPFLANLPRNSK